MKIDNSALLSLKTNNIAKINDYINSVNSESNNGGTDFANVLQDAMNSVNETDAADQASNMELLNGNANDLHSLMISAEKADIALSLTIQIRNKVLEAYNEVMRMQI